MSQTTAPAVNMDPAYAGLIAEPFGPEAIESRVSAVAQKFGYFVSQGTAADEVKVPAAATDITNVGLAGGIVCAHHSMESSSSGDPQYPAKATLPVLRKGKVWVKVESAVSIGGAAFVNWQNGNEGQFRHDNDGGNAAQVPNCFYRTAAGAGGLALVEINLP